MNAEDNTANCWKKGNYDQSPHSCSVRFENYNFPLQYIERLVPSSHQNQARSPAFHRIRSSAFHRISHRSHAFHRISHQPGWLTSCNTRLKVISAHGNSSANRASPAHIIRPVVFQRTT